MFLPKNGRLNWYSQMKKKWKNSVNFWHQKLTMEVQFWHFLTNRHSSAEFFNIFPLSMLILCQKSCFFRTHHLRNSTTELILNLKVWVSIEIFSAPKPLTMQFWLWGMERKRARIIGWSKIPGVPTGAMRGTLKWPEMSIFVELLTNLWCLWCNSNFLLKIDKNNTE